MSVVVGDRVRVIASRFGYEQIGLTGIVTDWERPSYPHHLNVSIRYDTPLGENCWHNTYADEDLEPYLTVRRKSGFGSFLERHAL